MLQLHSTDQPDVHGLAADMRAIAEASASTTDMTVASFSVNTAVMVPSCARQRSCPMRRQ
jgi:hypothetical protein